MNELAIIGNELLRKPILNALIAFYKIFDGIGLPGAFGLAIIALTILIRLILNPLTASQLKSAKKMQELKPKMDELSKKHGKDKVKLQQAQMQLYKEAGVNPASGCFLLLLQMPVLFALYNVFMELLGTGGMQKITENINHLVYFPFLKLDSLNFSFFGISLLDKPQDYQKIGWWLLLVPVITAALQWYQTKLMAPQALSQAPKPQGNKAAEKKEDDTAAIMQKQMGIMFPLMIGWFAFSFPIGLSLYWNTFSILGIIQQRQINKNKSEKIIYGRQKH